MKGGGVEGVKGSSWVWFQMPTTPISDFVKKSMNFLPEMKKIFRIEWFFGRHCNHKSLILVHSSSYGVVLRRYGLFCVLLLSRVWLHLQERRL